MTEQAEQVTQTAQNSGKSQTSLEIRHLVKRYANADKPVLDDISFDVPHGKVFVIVGPSGSGKSTTGRLICGLERADSGSIAYRGHDLATMSERERKPFRREIQLVFQDSSTAFDPRNRVGRILEEPLIIAGVLVINLFSQSGAH